MTLTVVVGLSAVFACTGELIPPELDLAEVADSGGVHQGGNRGGESGGGSTASAGAYSNAGAEGARAGAESSGGVAGGGGVAGRRADEEGGQALVPPCAGPEPNKPSGGYLGGCQGAPGACIQSAAEVLVDDGFWDHPYDSSCEPRFRTGFHNPGLCCSECHAPRLGPPNWDLAGTIYEYGTTNPARHVEIGIRTPTRFVSVCSGANGNFMIWPTSPGIEWEQAEVRIRSQRGEVVARKCTPNANCNSCHYLAPPASPLPPPFGGESSFGGGQSGGGGGGAGRGGAG